MKWSIIRPSDTQVMSGGDRQNSFAMEMADRLRIGKGQEQFARTISVSESSMPTEIHRSEISHKRGSTLTQSIGASASSC